MGHSHGANLGKWDSSPQNHGFILLKQLEDPSTHRGLKRIEFQGANSIRTLRVIGSTMLQVIGRVFGRCPKRGNSVHQVWVVERRFWVIWHPNAGVMWCLSKGAVLTPSMSSESNGK